MANIPASAKRKAVEKVKKTLAKEGIKLEGYQACQGEGSQEATQGDQPAHQSQDGQGRSHVQETSSTKVTSLSP